MEKGANFLFLTPKKEEFLLLSLPSLTCVMNYERGDKNAFSSLIVSLEQQKNDRRKCTRCNLVLISAKKLYCVKCATAQRELEREKQRKEKLHLRRIKKKIEEEKREALERAVAAATASIEKENDLLKLNILTQVEELKLYQIRKQSLEKRIEAMSKSLRDMRINNEQLQLQKTEIADGISKIAGGIQKTLVDAITNAIKICTEPRTTHDFQLLKCVQSDILFACNYASSSWRFMDGLGHEREFNIRQWPSILYGDITRILPPGRYDTPQLANRLSLPSHMVKYFKIAIHTKKGELSTLPRKYWAELIDVSQFPMHDTRKLKSWSYDDQCEFYLHLIKVGQVPGFLTNPTTNEGLIQDVYVVQHISISYGDTIKFAPEESYNSRGKFQRKSHGNSFTMSFYSHVVHYKWGNGADGDRLYKKETGAYEE